MRAFHMLRHMSEWASVDVVALAHDADEASRVGELRGVAHSATAVRVPKLLNLFRSGLALPSSTPMTHTMFGAPGMSAIVTRIAAERKPDVIVCYCTGVAPLVFLPELNTIPVVLDMVDVDSEKWAALASTSAPPRSWIYAREAKTLRAFEVKAVRRSATTLVVTDRERDSLMAIAPAASVAVIPNGVDVAALRPPDPPSPAPIVVFCGVMNYPPNVDGAVWLARDIWPLVQRARPDARLEIVGSHPTAAVRGLASASAGVTVTGHVADVRAHLWQAAVAAAPLRTARGVQNKVLEAVAAGLPVVTTPVVMRGLPAQVRAACTSAETAEQFAAGLVAQLAAPPASRRATAAGANLDSLTWSTCLRDLQSILTAATTRAPRAASRT